MTRLARGALAVLGVGLGVISGVLPAAAGSDDGNFQVRVLATVVDPETDATVRAGGAVIPGADADVSTEVIPALTLGYYLNQNLALELFCCFAKHEIDGKGTIANLGEIADTWIFPPALTLQYHFTGMGKFEPYVGAGVQYINFFDTGTGDNALGATRSILTRPGASRCKPASTSRSAMAGRSMPTSRRPGSTPPFRGQWRRRSRVVGDADLDPWIFSAGLGYRFNLGSIFGHTAEAAPIK